MLIVLLLCLLLLGWMLGKPYYVDYRRRQIRKQPFPATWREILRRRMPYFRLLPADLQMQLKQHIQVFLAEKKFIGCAGLELTEDMRVTIAAHACLLILNRKTDYYPKLERILVYPGSFIVDRVETDDAGVFSHQTSALSGESWSDGQVILSWEETLDDASAVNDGKNVVIHEFAHQLDQENGGANGAPTLARGEHYQLWAKVFAKEFNQLQQQAQTDQQALFDFYGAQNPAEFFAVVSEVFFEQPQQMASLHSELYQQMSRFYRVDPLSWQ
jgi:Mlc titration factor MtfA (ptsG expression regulator)